MVGRLTRDEQLEMVEQARQVVAASPFKRPMTPGGRRMLVKVSAAGHFGWWSDAKAGYRYVDRDGAGKPWPEMPRLWGDVADRFAGEHPWDSAILNWYEPEASLSWHVDKSEADVSLPIVTISLGDAASWAVRPPGGKATRCRVESGDVTLLAGPTRDWEHAIERIYPTPRVGQGLLPGVDEAPLLANPGRISITIRVAGDPALAAARMQRVRADEAQPLTFEQMGPIADKVGADFRKAVRR
ncbi:MAG: alpha-ketoglutarate-dependent dioxygenase AlkB [Myxococcales bacterium]|nr:alpha-ketoglutarate-dependent dioxygenase AlkB [Myxococcales bacterium]